MNPILRHLILVCLLLCLRSDEGRGAQDGLGALRAVSGALEGCGRLADLGTCLRLKAVTLLDRAIRSQPLVINDYLSLKASPEAFVNSTGPTTESEIEAALPKGRNQREAALDQMIAEKAATFVKTRSIKFHLPIDESSTEQGRKGGGEGGFGGGKKGGGMGIIFAMFFGFMIQAALAKIALIAGKALIVGKMALVLSALIGLKKLVSSEGGESTQVIYATGGHHHEGNDWGRSGHILAYSGHPRPAKL